MKHATLILCLLTASIFSQDKPAAEKPAAEKPADPGFEIKGLKCFSDKIINKAEVGASGFKVEAGFRVGTNLGPGSELSDFTFPENQLKQFFEFQFGEAAAGKTITATVKGMRTTFGAGIGVVEVSGKTDKNGNLPANWSLEKNWPVGLYKVFFTCDDQPVGSAGYLVKAVKDRESPIKATGVTIISYKDGKGTEKTTLTTADNDLIFKCATTGANTKGTTVRMLIGYEDDKGEKVIMKNSEVTMEDWPLEDTTLVYALELPEKFPAGDYNMVYFINDEPLIAHSFTVTE